MPDQPSQRISETMPVELAPVYRTASVNEAICLYEGPMTLNTDEQVEDGTGSVRLEWLPVPRFSFRWQSPAIRTPIEQAYQKTVSALNELKDASLRMENGREVRVQVMGIYLHRTRDVEGSETSVFVEDSEFGCGERLGSVLFHVPNFRSFRGSGVRDESRRKLRAARALMEADGWRITLEELEYQAGPDGETFGKQIEAAGGFGLTHVGKLERSGGATFSAAETKQLEDGLFWFLSFCRGCWVGPWLAVGFDTGGQRVWEEWRAWKTEGWGRVGSWFDTLSCVGLVEVFPGFYRRWKDEAWNEPIRLALHWYVESNMCAGGVEGGTILAQAAFELLAWTLLVEDRKVRSDDGFQRIPASDKLRLLLSACGIPLQIPASMVELSKVASEFNWQDGPQAITEVRNALVHASPKKRKKVLGGDAGARREAWWLGLWYLELVLLWLFDFHGKYSDRLVRNGWRGQEVKDVPWKVTP